MTITPFHSGVLLRLKGDVSNTAFGGVSVQDFHSPWNNMSVEAEVLAISARPFFMGEEMEAVRNGEENGAELREIADLCSTIGNVPVEVSVGDTVVFDWRKALPDAELAYRVGDGWLIVNYSDLIARVDDGGLYPLNGGVFAVPLSWSQVAAKMDRGDLWEVFAEGCLVDGWLDDIDPERGWPSLVGKTVCCDPRAPVAIEAPLFSKHDHSGKRFHVLNRHHIFAMLT